MERIRTLIFHYTDTNKLSYLDDWLDAFKSDGKYIVKDINLCGLKVFEDGKKEFDLIILLHSVLKSLESIKSADSLISNYLKNRKAKLLSFVADEVNLHITPLNIKINFLKNVEPDYIATQLMLEAGEWLYSEVKPAKIISLPHALNPHIFKPIKERDRRKYDIGIISVPYPIYLGDNERNEIMNFFERTSNKHKLKINIVRAKTRSQRLTRYEWANFLNDCKGTASSEAGTYYLEKDDKTVLEVMNYLKEKIKKEKKTQKIIDNENKLWKIWNLLPFSLREFIKRNLFIKDTFLSSFTKSLINWDGYISYEENFFEEVYNLFFKNKPKAPVYTKAISSRHFDAIGTKTVQILFEGKYNNILIPDEHFIALKKDFSNFEEVIIKFKDENYARKIADNAYEFVLNNHTYKNRLDEIYYLIMR